MKNKQKILDGIKRNNITVVRFQWIGTDLLLRTMIAHSDYVEDSVMRGIGITKAIQSSSAWDTLAAGGFGPESGEFKIVPDCDTFAVVPYTPRTGRFICELCDENLKPTDTDPRYFLRRVLDRAEEMGYRPMAACESEFNIFTKDGDKLIPLEDLGTGSPLAIDIANPLLQEWISSLSEMNVKVERVKKEGGEGQLELVLRYANALKAADDMATLRDVAKGVALRHGYSVTFMPKIFRFPNGMHIHMSLWDVNKSKNTFADSSDENGLSECAYHFVGGILKNMKALCALAAPLPTSYRRLLPGTWAPSYVYYGFDNRAAAIRVPSQSVPKREDATRIEYRLPDPTANPYLALGSAIACGLEGIKRKEDPGDALNVDASKLDERELENLHLERLPSTLMEALAELKKSSFLCEVLGKSLLDTYIRNRELEWRAYMEHVSEWEIRSYIDHF
jgi:glutamine synthetase